MYRYLFLARGGLLKRVRSGEESSESEMHEMGSPSKRQECTSAVDPLRV